MKVAIVTQYYPPEIGAPQARLSELARRFVERGHQVVVLTAMPSYPRGRIYQGYGGAFRREEQEGVVVLRCPIYPTRQVRMLPRLANYFSFVLSSVIVGTAVLPRVDYLLTESPPLFLGISGYLLSRGKGARWIFNVSDLWPDTAVRLGVVRAGFGLRVAQALEALCYRRAWLVTGQTRGIVSTIRSRFPRVPTYHLSNGVDTNLFRPERRSEQARRELGDGAAVIAIYAGLHGLAQGLEQLLEAAARLRDVEDLRIVLVGDGPEKERLLARRRALNLANVRFLDPCPREAMPEILASADIGLVTLREGFPDAAPSKLYEAMGAGLPVAVVSDGEAADIVSVAGAGVVVAPWDVDGLAAALRDLVKDEDRRHRLGVAARRAAVARFDRRAIADAFVDLLEEGRRPQPSPAEDQRGP